MKKILITFLLFVVSLMVACQSPITKEKVDIRSLSASVTNNTSEQKLSKQRNLAFRPNLSSFDDLNGVEETYYPDGQYILIYKDEKNIDFTIKLNNPKGEAIDAVQITCDDPNSKVLVDGKYMNIQYDDEKSIVINWAQENAYEKTYHLETTSVDDVNTIRVLDIKVNGEWQNQELSKDRLDVYKIDDSILHWNFIYNKETEYAWNFEYDTTCISNLQVYYNGNEISSELDTYRVGNGLVEYEFDYTFEDKVIHWKRSRNIELLELCVPEGGIPLNNIGDVITIKISILKGTDVSNEFYFYFEGKTYIFNNSRPGWYSTMPSEEWKSDISPSSDNQEEFRNAIINIGGCDYIFGEIFFWHLPH